jgi:hypothetical protein
VFNIKAKKDGAYLGGENVAKSEIERIVIRRYSSAITGLSYYLRMQTKAYKKGSNKRSLI